MRRRKGALVPLEVAALEAGLALREHGTDEFHGFLLAKHIGDGEDAKRLTAQGTMYRSLARLEKAGLLASRWEDPQKAAEEGRPLRRLYRVTEDGEVALARARSERAGEVGVAQPGTST